MHADVPEPLSAVVTELFSAANQALLNERGPSEECMQRARGGLAPWQIRKLITYIDVNLDRTITTQCLAEVARLSSFHFCRAFRDSFGDSPHGHVIRRRMERAQGLMLTTGATLGQIAAQNPDYANQDWSEVQADLQRGWNAEHAERYGDWSTVSGYASEGFTRGRSRLTRSAERSARAFDQATATNREP